MSKDFNLELIRDILSACEGDHMPNQRFQDPPIEIRKDVKRRYYFIRPRVPVLGERGMQPKRQPYKLGFVDETTMRQAKAEKERIMAPINAGRSMVQSQIPFSALVEKYLKVHVPTLGPAARLTYERHIRLHIRPVFDRYRMCDVNKLAV